MMQRVWRSAPPVTYRGILVGSVRSIAVTPEAVVAELEINNADLLLPMPVTATVEAGSLLGGNGSLVSRGLRCRRMHPPPALRTVGLNSSCVMAAASKGVRRPACPP